MYYNNIIRRGMCVLQPEYQIMKNNGINIHENPVEQYYYKSIPIKKNRYCKYKRNAANRKKKHFPVKRTLSLVVCLILLFFIFPYSFNLYIKDIFPSKTNKYLNLDNSKLLKTMYPVQSLLSVNETVLGKYEIGSIKYDKPLMLDIPENFQRKRLKSELLELADNYKSIYPSIYVWEYKGHSFVDINANEPFPAASIIKVPVLIELFRDIEHNKFSLFDKMIFEDYFRAEGSGKLKYTPEGIEHTLDYLARIMIENSDNSSTNMLVSKIGGMPEVNQAIKRWGLKATKIRNWLPDLDGTNTTTAREMAKMLYNIDSTNLLTNESKKYIADYMSNVKNTRLLKSGLPKDAKILHKTGDIGFMLGDAGIVRASNGKKYIVVIMVRRPYNSMQGREFIVNASKLIYDNIAI